VILAHVVGTVVSTRKDERLCGFKLLVLAPNDGGNRLVAIDTVDAGIGDRVLVVQGSAARLSTGLSERPIDAAIVGVVDSVTE